MFKDFSENFMQMLPVIMLATPFVAWGLWCYWQAIKDVDSK